MLMFACFLVVLSSPLARAAGNFSTVYEWDELEYNWLPKVRKEQALRNGTYRPLKIEPRHLAIYEQRLFLGLVQDVGVPATLVWLPTEDASASPTMRFSSWAMDERCSTMQSIRGMDVDSLGRFWVVDNGCETSCHCPAKLWIFNLTNLDRIDHVHQFPENTVSRAYWERSLQDFALDETPDDDTYAYATDVVAGQIVVFTLRKKESWAVQVHGKRFRTLACSQQLLFLNEENSYDLYSASLSELRLGIRIVVPKMVGSFSAYPYRMFLDKGAVMYAAFLDRSYISTWKTNQDFKEERFFEDKGKNKKKRQFTLARALNGESWMMVSSSTKPRFRLLKASIVPSESNKMGKFVIIISLSASGAIVVLSIGAIVLWLCLRRKTPAQAEIRRERTNPGVRDEQCDSGLYDEPMTYFPPVNMNTRPRTSEVLRMFGSVPPVSGDEDDKAAQSADQYLTMKACDSPQYL